MSLSILCYNIILCQIYLIDFLDNFIETPYQDISKLFQDGAKAIIVKYDGDKHHIITQQDMIKAIA